MLALDNATRLMKRLRITWTQVSLDEVACAFGRCPFCGPSAFVRLYADSVGVRCIRCFATAVHMSLGFALRSHVPNLDACSVCELSARGPLAAHLARHARSVALSEYFTDISLGAVRGGVRCEDVQHLTYADASFDVVTHTEVLEHVPDDRRALAELRRVLRADGIMLFTVPLHGRVRTLERARPCAGSIVHLQPPAYHRDPLRGGAGILAFRDYGVDIVERLLAAGFTRAWVESPPKVAWDHGRNVVIARCSDTTGWRGHRQVGRHAGRGVPVGLPGG